MNTAAAVVGMIIAALGFALLVSVIFAIPVMLLWDWLMPTIFGLKEITLMQAWGMLLLSGLLFRSTSTK